jgi:putative transcriptional regulator
MVILFKKYILLLRELIQSSQKLVESVCTVMVRIKLSELLGKHKMNQKTLSKLTGIRPATLSKMYYEETKRIEIDQINKICAVFQCRIEDLIEYVPDEK